MSDPSAPGPAHAGLNKLYFVCFTEPVVPVEDLEAHLDEHKAYLGELEALGRLFAAGPLLDEDLGYSGVGMIILRAESRDEAARLADQDPFHALGLRRYRLQPWQMNEGTVQLVGRFSTRTFTIE